MPDYSVLVLIALLALLIDGLAGEPEQLWGRIGHPVTWMGGLVDALDHGLNRHGGAALPLKAAGVLALLIMLLVAGLTGAAISLFLPASPLGYGIEALIVSVFLAQRSLYQHVAAVGAAFEEGGLSAARKAVSQIVGRDPEMLDEAGVARAAIESCAENFSDGIVAPLFWYLIGGLPGLLAYKMLNTADSMIGYRSVRHEHFGWAAARCDDAVNLVPARLAGLMIAVAGAAGGAPLQGLKAMWRDAASHRSPNAGWPEAAMAGVLGLALAGPRIYDGRMTDDGWMNGGGRIDAEPKDISTALRLYLAACGVQFLLVGLLAVALWLRL